jgi:hypothetical protein
MGKCLSSLMWSGPDVLGLFSLNVGSNVGPFSLNLVLSGPLFSLNVVPKPTDVMGSGHLCSRAATPTLLAGLTYPPASKYRLPFDDAAPHPKITLTANPTSSPIPSDDDLT